ncbi:MAG: OmpP1/FadL family transporter [Panacagrimonas sp.]
MPHSIFGRLSAACSLLLCLMPAHATLGIFEHGNGIKSCGLGGITYGLGEEAVVLSANPAHAAALGTRYDVGVNVFLPMSTSRIHDNALGPDDQTDNDGRRWYPIPQGGFTRALDDRWTLGMAIYAAGMGPDYARNPYRRFGASPRASLFLTSVGVATALAWQVNPQHALGASLNLGYQSLNVEGVGFFAPVSSAPDKLSNQGNDGSPTAGFSLGWLWHITPTLQGGFGYRSKSWTPRHREYRGLVPDGGRLELPAIWGAGLAWTPIPDWTLAFDFQRYQFSSEGAFGNRFGELQPPDRLLGDEDGVGFGFDNQNAYKFGIAWKATPALVLRVGYIEATQINQPSETVLGAFGPVTATTHYTFGGTWSFREWELSGYAYHSPENTVRGRGSIPAAFGGGEADAIFEGVGAGFSVGRRFGARPLATKSP